MKSIEIGLIVLALLVLVVKRLPDLAKSVGKTVKNYKEETRSAPQDKRPE